MTQDKKNLENTLRKDLKSGDNALFTDMIIRPCIRKIGYSLNIVQSYGYVLSEIPCEVCYKETDDPRMRPFGWDHICDRCGNYIIYADLTDYLKVFGKDGRLLEEVQNRKNLYYHYLSRERLEPKASFPS